MPAGARLRDGAANRAPQIEHGARADAAARGADGHLGRACARVRRLGCAEPARAGSARGDGHDVAEEEEEERSFLPRFFARFSSFLLFFLSFLLANALVPFVAWPFTPLPLP